MYERQLTKVLYLAIVWDQVIFLELRRYLGLFENSFTEDNLTFVFPLTYRVRGTEPNFDLKAQSNIVLVKDLQSMQEGVLNGTYDAGFYESSIVSLDAGLQSEALRAQAKNVKGAEPPVYSTLLPAGMTEEERKNQTPTLHRLMYREQRELVGHMLIRAFARNLAARLLSLD